VKQSNEVISANASFRRLNPKLVISLQLFAFKISNNDQRKTKGTKVSSVSAKKTLLTFC